MTIYFYKSIEPYGYLNNFHKSKFIIYDLEWSNVEAAYQSRKTLVQKEIDEIYNSASPREARNLGQLVKMRSDWDDIKCQVMKECVSAKFKQNLELAKRLLSTENEDIVEDSKIDFYWGCGADGKGLNNLGKILMEVRSELKK